jgi:hypothetical protein
MAGTAGLRRDERAGAPPIELDAQPIIVEGLVAEQSVECDSLDQWFDPDAVVALAGQKNEAYEIAERLDHCDDLGGQATSRPANGLISSLDAMLVGPDDRAVDDRVFEIQVTG